MSTLTDRDTSFLRQMAFADPSKFKKPVTILGVGSVGTVSSISIGKMGVRQISLIDFDVFEAHNVSNQLCLEKDHLGQYKVDAIGDLTKNMAPYGLEIVKHCAKLSGNKLVDARYGKIYDAKPIMKRILINCPDDMVARKDAWELCKFNPSVSHVVDVRMAAQYLKIYITSTMDIQAISRYEKTLHTNELASEDPCGMRAIIYTSLIAGALVAKFVRNLQLGEPVPEEYEMDLHNGTVQQVIKGKVVASREEHALAFVS